MLSDLMMADLDGIGLLERTKEKYPDMPVVMVTAVHDISVALAAIRNGAYDYLLKPFEREQLLATVRRALENRRLKLENHAYQTRPGSPRSPPAPSNCNRRCSTWSAPTTSRSKLWAMLSTLRTPRPKAIPSASPRSPSPSPAHGSAQGRNHRDRPRSLPARYRQDGHSRRHPAQTRRATPDEITIMREHCYRGYQIAAEITFSAEASEIVYSHQERYDGTGYPARIEGRRDSLGSAHLLRGRHARCHHLRPPLPCGTVGNSRARRDSNAGPDASSIPTWSNVFLSMKRTHLGRPAQRNRRPDSPVAYSTAARGSS